MRTWPALQLSSADGTDAACTWGACSVAQSRPTLCGPVGCGLQAPLSMGFSRQEPAPVRSHFLLQAIVPMTVLDFFLPESSLKRREWVGESWLPALTLQILWWAGDTALHWVLTAESNRSLRGLNPPLYLFKTAYTMGALFGTGKATLFSLFIAPHGIQNLPDQGSNPSPLQGKCGILTAGPPGKSREAPLDAVGNGPHEALIFRRLWGAWLQVLRRRASLGVFFGS